MSNSLFDRLLRKIRHYAVMEQFRTTEVHVHPLTAKLLERELLYSGYWEPTPSGPIIHGPVCGPVRVIETETVPPGSLQLRKAAS